MILFWPKTKSRRKGLKDGARILEALSATGIRAIRYAKEIDGIEYVIANDMDKNAVDEIRRNVSRNGLSERLVQPSHEEANAPYEETWY